SRRRRVPSSVRLRDRPEGSRALEVYRGRLQEAAVERTDSPTASEDQIAAGKSGTWSDYSIFDVFNARIELTDDGISISSCSGRATPCVRLHPSPARPNQTWEPHSQLIGKTF